MLMRAHAAAVAHSRGRGAPHEERAVALERGRLTQLMDKAKQAAADVELEPFEQPMLEVLKRSVCAWGPRACIRHQHATMAAECRQGQGSSPALVLMFRMWPAPMSGVVGYTLQLLIMCHFHECIQYNTFQVRGVDRLLLPVRKLGCGNLSVVKLWVAVAAKH